MSWLINSIEVSIGKTYLFLPTAKDVWDAIRETYSDLKNSSQILELKTRLCKLGKVIMQFLSITMRWSTYGRSLINSMKMNGPVWPIVFVIKNELNIIMFMNFWQVWIRDFMKCKAGFLAKFLCHQSGKYFLEVQWEEGRRKVMFGEKIVSALEVSALIILHPRHSRTRKKKRCGVITATNHITLRILVGIYTKNLVIGTHEILVNQPVTQRPSTQPLRRMETLQLQLRNLYSVRKS